MIILSSILKFLQALSPLFIGVSIFQFLFFRSWKKKFKAGTNQEVAKADGMNLDNLSKYIKMQGDELIKTTMDRDNFIQENLILKTKLSEYDFKLMEMDRKVRGVQNTIATEISQRQYAEKHICLNLQCRERVPALGTYKINNET